MLHKDEILDDASLITPTTIHDNLQPIELSMFPLLVALQLYHITDSRNASEITADLLQPHESDDYPKLVELSNEIVGRIQSIRKRVHYLFKKEGSYIASYLQP